MEWIHMAVVNPVQLLAQTLVPWNFIILILGGILAASWLLIRFSGVSSDDMSNIIGKISLLGFPVGIVALLTIGAGLYLWSKFPDLFISPNEYSTFDIVTIGCLALLGLVLILRPIKDFRFGAFLSLGIGLLGAGLLIFLGSESVQLLAIVFVILFIGIYLSIKLVEDLYLMIAEALSSPLISVIVGILCIIQGTLEIFGMSIGGIISLFLPV
jgi:hypothetical protein